MINIKLVCVGSLKEKFWVDAEKEYEKRLGKFCKIKVVELEQKDKLENVEKIKEAEGKEILENLEGKVYLLDIKGKELSSEEFAQEIDKSSLSSSTITFVIGGSCGVSNEVKDKIQNKISFGRATYPHNLARIILIEQIYRAFMILSGAKYHK